MVIQKLHSRDQAFCIYKPPFEAKEEIKGRQVEVMESYQILIFVFSIIPLAFVFFYKRLRSKQEKIIKFFKNQGIDGPSPSLFHGNLSEIKSLSFKAKIKAKYEVGGRGSLTQDYAKTLFPHLHQWRKTYGSTFLFWLGRRPIVCVSRPDIVRELSLKVSLDLGKGTHHQKIQEPLFGHGIIKANGLAWAHQRKTIAPEFFPKKIKGMVQLMVDSAIPLLKSWEDMLEQKCGTAEIVVDEYFRSFSADVISRACFGGSYSKGNEIFTKLRALSSLISDKRMHFEPTCIKFLPTKADNDIKKLEREIRSLILKVVQERTQRTTFDDDLLRSILENANVGQVGSDSADNFIVDNCKNIYFAGHETTAVTATWCLMLLAVHPQWQDRVRAELKEVCGGKLPNVDMIARMKMLALVIQETVRLYPPSPFVARETFQDMDFGQFHCPKGIEMWIPTSALHHDKNLWGADAEEFKPERFANGISSACQHPNAYIPFGFGGRTCLGQNLALTELKVVLSLLLSKFTFSLSKEYRHSPAFRLIVEPEFGLQLVIKKVKED